MHRILISLLVFVSFCSAASKDFKVTSDLDYLPKDITYDASIPSPSEVLGYPVGTWHVRHDQLVQYMYKLAEVSPRVSIIETGRTHEHRPLLQLRISTPDNIIHLEEIRQAHVKRIESQIPADPKTDPAIIWMGYSVHGNEPSGANASMLIAYYLAAAQGEQVKHLLNNSIILIDPSLNPDGLARFAQWANTHKGQNLVADPNHREHIEGWPSGRTNHYWFDLNRDWLVLTHPESKARIKQFHQWRPHVLTDFHEMGTNSSYFFQPGIPSRKNPFTPESNPTLTAQLAQYHAGALDKQKRLYFTEEGFDDFYYGKGSTYPDALGSIGILFEQASSRGHLQESEEGLLSFPFSIHNQIITSLSTFDGMMALKAKFMHHQLEFAKETQSLASKDKYAGYLLTERHDVQRLQALLTILDAHAIRYYPMTRSVTVDDVTYPSLNTVYVPLEQPQYRLIKSIFSTRKRFNDNTFYDVSNWNLPLSFNIEFQPVGSAVARSANLSEPNPRIEETVSNRLSPEAYAFAFSWKHLQAPTLLGELLAKNIHVKVADRPFVTMTQAGEIAFEPGSVVIPLGVEQPADVVDLVAKASKKANIKVWNVTSGLTGQGIDLGSRNMGTVAPIKVLLVGGLGTSQYEVGEIWHYFDQRLKLPSTLVELDRLSSIDLADYSHIVMAQGSYGSVPESVTKKLTDWLSSGGVLIGQKNATRWFTQNEWLNTKFLSSKDINKAFDTDDLTYGDRESLQGKMRVSGAVFKSTLDLTHPLAYGIFTDTLPLFKNSNAIMLPVDKPFVNVANYVEKPLWAGYASDEIESLIGNSAAIVAHNYGQGKVIGFADDINFRGYWYGTSRLMANALFMSHLINAGG